MHVETSKPHDTGIARYISAAMISGFSVVVEKLSHFHIRHHTGQHFPAEPATPHGGHARDWREWEKFMPEVEFID